jgi:ubiquinone/menaquinone biosynthesis C-methylase UbiE
MSRFTETYFRTYTSTTNGIRKFVRDRLNLTPRAPWLFRHIAELPANAKALDVGCGTGGFLEIVERSNPAIHTVGVDLGTPPEFLAQGTFLRGSALALPFAADSFDLVACSHVIEHLNDPEGCVRELMRVTKPGGIVYIETPSPRSAWVPLFNTFWDDPTHIRPYSKTALRRLLEITGGSGITAGTKRSLPAVLFGLPYLPIGILLGDRQAKAMFSIYAFGFSVWAGASKAPAE